jgi:hypothetical protein
MLICLLVVLQVNRQDAPQVPICNLNIALPSEITPEPEYAEGDEVQAEIKKKYQFLRKAGYGKER